MSKIKQKKINREILGVFGFSFAFLYMLFSVFLNHSFTSDHVASFVSGSHAKWPDFMQYMSGGRIVSYFISIIGWGLNKLGISKGENLFILQLLTMFLLACAVCMLYSLFQGFFEEKKQKLILPILLVIAFGNSFFGETFVYIGYELAVGIVLAILAVKVFVKKKYILGTVLVFFSCSIYQSYIAIFLIYTSLYLYLESKGVFEFRLIWRYVKLALIALLAAIGNIMIAKIPVLLGSVTTEVKAVSGSLSIAQRIENIMYGYRNILKTACGYYPDNYLLVLVLLFLVGISVYLIFKRRKILDLLYFVLFFCAMNLFYVVLFALTSSPWPAQRVVWPVFCSISSFFVVCLYYFKESICEKILLGVFICFMGVNIYYTQTAAMDFYISNKLDSQIVKSVEREIRKYEAETGNTITTVSAKLMPGADYCYSQLNLSYPAMTYNHKTLYDEWSDVELLNYLTGKRYKQVRMSDEIFEKYFSDVEYSVYMPEEQLVFEGDTLYWLIF